MMRLIATVILAFQLAASGIGFGPTCPAIHAVAGFMPTQVRYCQLWVDANRVCMSSGSFVDDFEDFSLVGNGPLSAVTTGRPTISNVNGRPCLKFDGVNDYMTIGNLTLVTDVILFAVLKDGTNRFVIEHSPSVILNDGFYLSGGPVPWGVRRTALRQANGTSGWAGSDFCVVSFSYNTATTNGVTKKNGVEQSIPNYAASGVPANLAITTGLFLNSSGGLSDFSDASVAEIVIVTNSISGPVEQSMLRYLGVKYGIIVP